MRNRFVIAAATALFLVLAGTGTGHAYWSAQARATASVGSGAIDVSAAVGLAWWYDMTYTPTQLSFTAPLTVTNTGTITAPHTMTLGAQVANTLAAAVVVNTWPVRVASDCTATSALPAGATASNWTNVPPHTRTLEPSTSVVYCVRSSITSGQQTSLAGTRMVAVLSLDSAVGTWSKTIGAQGSQSVADTAAPTTPGTPVASGTTDSQTTLTWSASTDNVGVIAYDVYRHGAYIATVRSASFTNTGLTVETAYRYSVRAKDAAGNTSAASGAVGVTTTSFSSTRWYRVTDSRSGSCVDANGATPSDGTQLILFGCHGNANQQWQFVSNGNGSYRVLARYAPTLAWDIHNGVEAGKTDGAPAQLWTYSGSENQRWYIQSTGGGTFNFVSVNSGKCLDGTAPAAGGTQLQQWTCDTTRAQAFTLAGVG